MIYVNKYNSNRRIHLGLIARCKSGENYGLVYGFRETPQGNYEHKLLYFQKKPDMEMNEHTLVSYLSYDFDGFTPLVEYVFAVFSLIVWHDAFDKKRADYIYHDDKVWNMLDEGIPYLNYDDSDGLKYCIYYPIINGNICTVWRGRFCAGYKEFRIYETMKELNNLNYQGWPSVEDVAEKIAQIKKYIESINAYEIIDTYRIEQINSYHSKPGGDDSYAECIYWKLQSDDDYLNFLLPTKDELTFFDGNAYRSDGYKEGHFLLEEETIQAIDKAKRKYSKDKHMAFLIRDYFAAIEEKKEQSKKLKKTLFDEFDIDRVAEIVRKFSGNITDSIMALINEYNDSTVVEPLELN